VVVVEDLAASEVVAVEDSEEVSSREIWARLRLF
jgi:hypothetical protein